MAVNNRITRIYDERNKDGDIKLGINDSDINKRYLNGQTIDYDNFNFNHVSMPFQEFMVKFHGN